MKTLISLALAATLSLVSFDTAIATPKNLDHLNTRLDRTLVLRGRIDEPSATQLVGDLTSLDDGEEIVLVIDSPGGSVSDGIDIINRIETLHSPLTCVISQEAFSMAAMISAYCPTLYIHKFGMLMFHQASFQVAGNETTIRVRSRAMQTMLDQVFNDVAARLHQKPEEFRAKIHDEWWIGVDEALALGFVTGKLEKLPELPTKPSIFSFDIPLQKNLHSAAEHLVRAIMARFDQMREFVRERINQAILRQKLTAPTAQAHLNDPRVRPAPAPHMAVK